MKVRTPVPLPAPNSDNVRFPEFYSVWLMPRVKSSEIVADNLSKAGWELVLCHQRLIPTKRTIWIGDAHHQADHELPIQIPTRKTNTPPTIT